ncbi:TPA: conjugal transfer protein TraP [Escherichia coli]|uniref:conjugal transfer protein TraP n=1 Tax=Escherichia coli TaxID=562 RepID=UPI000D13B7D7|nr:conjugal transfer protein TraP [Escherichia coli]EEX3420791.1 conjugal transfer protein TraP [Escherichia coli]EEZ5180874.1 conjugal transfer protein TraP [Escherichia coli]EFA9813210.1 conjugal transfer protein TraP [Escherichia coli]EFB6243130.1 conjugal transfer protein TraP [Escherichia coli]EFC3824636.1 conjugal transfer protein TraP [Escherichia coli]
MKNEHEDPGSFGETPAPASGKSFLKRQYMGYSLPVWAGCALIILAAIWYKFLRTPSEPPADAGFAVTAPAAESWAEPITVPGSGNNMSVQPVAPQADMQQLARDLKAELDRRDEDIRRTLTMLKDSITTLSNTIQKDEAWAQETRQLLDETRKQVHTLQMQGPLQIPTGNNGQSTKTPPPRLQGMKIMSVEKGMVWIRWQGSAWAVREGDRLGNITITRIDPSSRSVITSAGILR